MDYKEKVIALLNSKELSREQKEKLEEIFPELAESEDERIRKEIIDFATKTNNGVTSILANNYNFNKWLAWLEKQGKNNMGISEATKKELEDNLNKALEKETPESWNEFLEKQGEQEKLNTYIDKLASDTIYNDENGNPIDKDLMAFASKVAFSMIPVTKTESYHHLNRGRISDAVIKGAQWQKKKSEQKAVIVPKFRIGDTVRAKTMKNFVFTIKDIIDKQYVDTNDGKYDIEGQDYLELVEQKSEWSDEDEAIYYGVIETEQYMLDVVNGIKKFNVGNISIKEECTRELNWLKSLKDRVQPKQEWSDKDNHYLYGIIGLIEQSKEGLPIELKGKAADNCINWLKSLRPQKQWKPSDEQMDALRYVTNFDYGGHKATLVSLYEQLKKLK